VLLAAKVTLRLENGVLMGGLTADDFYEYWWSMRIIPDLPRLSKRGAPRYLQLSGLRGLIRHRRVQLALSIRVTIAAVLALALAQFVQLPLPLWAVMTAVIVTQMSVGRSLKTTFDYLVGTLGGAIYGGAVGFLIPHSNQVALLAVLAIAVARLRSSRR
jgi:uncharacterized membrane protein YccC